MAAALQAARDCHSARATGFSRTYLVETGGIHLAGEDCTPEQVAARFEEISDRAGAEAFQQGGEQVMKFVSAAAALSQG